MKLTNSSVKKLKKNFPILKNIVYLDNASTSQKPKQVLKAVTDFYEKSNANAGRGIYKLAQNATKKYEEARNIIANFINAKPEETVFTKNATESLNLLSYALPSIISKERNEILLTEMEHHSNLIPWQEAAKRNNMNLRFIKIKDNLTLDLEDARKKISGKTAILSITHVSNSFGTINPIGKLVKLAKEKGIITIVDAAQSVPHMKIDVKKIDCDFLVFSGHKMLALNGIGVLYGKKEILQKMQPFIIGGGMIKSVLLERTEFADIPQRFEAGTQNIGGAVALAEAIKYLNKIGMKNIESWEKKLLNYAMSGLSKIDGVKIYNLKNQSGVLSFNITGLHSHDVASLLDDYNICIRAGHHCNMPLMKKLNISGTARVSFYFYNTKEDVDKLIHEIKKIVEKVK